MVSKSGNFAIEYERMQGNVQAGAHLRHPLRLAAEHFIMVSPSKAINEGS